MKKYSNLSKDDLLIICLRVLGKLDFREFIHILRVKEINTLTRVSFMVDKEIEFKSHRHEMGKVYVLNIYDNSEVVLRTENPFWEKPSRIVSYGKLTNRYFFKPKDLPGTFTDEYLKFVKYCNKNDIKTNFTRNQKMFIEFCLKNQKEVTMLGDMKSVFSKIKNYSK